MKLTHLLASGALGLLAGSAIAQADDASPNGCPVTLSLDPSTVFAEETFTLTATGTPGTLLCLLFDIDPGPVTVPGVGTFGIGGTPSLVTLDTVMPPTGELTIPYSVPCDAPFLPLTLFIQGFTVDPATLGICIVNQVTLTVNPLPGGCPPPCTGEIGDFVFVDENGNGVQGANEPGIPGVEMTLLDDDGNAVGTTVTDSDGFYSFLGLCAGDYTVVVGSDSVPLDVAPTLCNVGTNTATDSSCGSEGTTLPDDNGFDPTLDFGYGPCSPCDGKVNALSLSYDGPSEAYVEVLQKDDTVVFAGLVAPGQPFTFFGTESDDNHLDSEIEVFVNGHLNVKIHTSCSDPIGVGFQFGDFTVLAGSSVDGGLLCANLGCEIDKPEALVFEYTGLGCDASNNPQEGKATCSGDPNLEAAVHIVVSDDNGDEIYFSGTVLLGECFEASALLAGEDDFPSNTVVEISKVGGGHLQSLEIHTSCSKDLAVGDQFGALLLKEFTPKGFGPQAADDCTAGKPQALTFTYTGEDCSASNNPQEGKATCSGDANFAPLVEVVFSDGDNDIYFVGTVALGGSFTADATTLGDDSFSSNSAIDVYDLDGNLLQALEVHTSCSKPLAVGNQFGSMLLTEFTPEP